MRNLAAGIFTLTGMIIGAGVLGIPYVIYRSGFWTGVLMIAVVALVLLYINLMIGEVSLRTKGDHQLVGFADKYIGKNGRMFMFFALAFSCYSALIAYTLGVSESLAVLFGGSQGFWAVLFYLAMAIVLWGGIRVLGGSETYLELVQFAVLVVLLYFAFGFENFNPEFLSGFSMSMALIPLGVILFAFGGTSAVPLLKQVLAREKRKIMYAVVAATAIVAVVYVLFSAAVIGVTGGGTTEVATIGLSSALGSPFSYLIHCFAILAMTTSFIAIAFVLKEMYIEDMKFKQFDAWSLTVFLPPAAILLGATSFSRTLDVGGSISMGFIGLLVLYMHKQAKRRGNRKPEYSVSSNYILYGLAAVLFVLAMLNSLLSFL